MFKLSFYEYFWFIGFGIVGSVYSLGFLLGPANFVFKSVEDCPNAPKEILLLIRMRKLDRINIGLTIEIDSPYDFDDQLELVMTSCTRMDGGCKSTFFWNDTDVCRSLETFIGDVFADFRIKAGMEDRCPVPKGKYRVEDWIFDNEKLTIPQLFGEYRSKIILMRKGVALTCLVFEYDLLPKNKLL